MRRAASVVLGLLLVGVATSATIVSHTASVRIDQARRAATLSDLYQDARFFTTSEASAVDTYRVEPTPANWAEHASAAANATAALVALQTVQARSDQTTNGDTATLATLAAVHQRFTVVAQQVLQLTDAGQRAQAVFVDDTQVEPLRAQLRTGLSALEERHHLIALAATESAHNAGSALRWGTPVVLLLSLLLISALWWMSRTYDRTVEHQHFHDRLTGLPNRALFNDRAAQLVATAHRGDIRPVVLMLDVDGFKDVNNTMGHHHGDDLLLQVATRLRTLLRPSDTVARLGGNEFGVLLSDGGLATGADVAARILTDLEDPFLLAGIAVGVEASIGIALVDDLAAGHQAAADQVDQLVRRSSAAMYQAKRERHGFVVFDRSAELATTRHMSLLSELRTALDHGELVLHYQPKVAADTGDLVSVEALVRWQHPQRGLLPPGEFIELAEGTTLIHRLTDIVVDEALSFCRRWLDQGVRLPVAVNVSARSLLDNAFATKVAARLREHAVPADLLCVELTEGTIMSDPDRAIGILNDLRALGIWLSIDDFGTGYSSMTYLKVLPVDELKVDRSFVAGMTTSHSDAVLVKSTIDLGHNLGLSVVAEGVEDADTLEALRTFGADVVQGYFVARPMPEPLLVEWVNSRTATTLDVPDSPEARQGLNATA